MALRKYLRRTLGLAFLLPVLLSVLAWRTNTDCRPSRLMAAEAQRNCDLTIVT